MMMYFLGLVLVTVASVQARTFNNPILWDKPYFEPGAIKVDGTYYVVATTSNVSEGTLPIHSSTDLDNWKFEGYVFSGNNTPNWGTSTYNFGRIYKIGINYQIYFTGSSDNKVIAGVAQAAHPAGPYTVFDRPILPAPSSTQYAPSLINDPENLYLLYTAGVTFVARQLESNGLSYYSNQTTTLLSPSLSWEGGILWTSYYIQRGNYHYILYTAGTDCYNLAVGVARSSNALGPYQKLPNPIFVQGGTDFSCAGDVSVVRDWENNGDLIFFNGYAVDVPAKAILMASLDWTGDDWPSVGDL